VGRISCERDNRFAAPTAARTSFVSVHQAATSRRSCEGNGTDGGSRDPPCPGLVVRSMVTLVLPGGAMLPGVLAPSPLLGTGRPRSSSLSTVDLNAGWVSVMTPPFASARINVPVCSAAAGILLRVASVNVPSAFFTSSVAPGETTPLGAPVPCWPVSHTNQVMVASMVSTRLPFTGSGR
jgi:hypothetical protein